MKQRDNDTTAQRDNAVTLYSGSEVARHADMAASRFTRLLRSGDIRPDYRQGSSVLFTLATRDAVARQYGSTQGRRIDTTGAEIGAEPKQ